MERAGFEPAKALPTDLQSVPVDRLGTSPKRPMHYADGGTRTPNPLITNQVLYQLSHISVRALNHASFCQCAKTQYLTDTALTVAPYRDIPTTRQHLFFLDERLPPRG